MSIAISLVRFIWGMAEVVSLILGILELYKLYTAWRSRRSAGSFSGAERLLQPGEGLAAA